MFCFRQSNNLINKVNERALKLIYQHNCNFEVLLEKQRDFSIRQRNLQVLITEIYEIVNCIAPPIMNSQFTFVLNQHNLRNFQELWTEKGNTVNYGLEIVTYRAPVLWAKLPPEYKFAGSLTAFKSKIKSCRCGICTCGPCKEYQPSLGYIYTIRIRVPRYFYLLMLELQHNAHCVSFQKDPEKGYHWNDPSRYLHDSRHKVVCETCFRVNNQGIGVQHSSFSNTDFELVKSAGIILANDLTCFN